MSAFDKIMPAAFLACVALTACNGGQRDGYAHNDIPGKVETVMQPDKMPAPQNEQPVESKELAGRDSAKTGPLDSMDAKKESSSMPEALQGNNHSSPNVGSDSIKKSSTLMTKSPKVIWV